ncbi:MAG: hypothetical protein IKG35_03650 [Erysipelotrichaceae bacterium]|nr:hypothetical protein [Erysipelotrichaceae bacterium]
MSDFDLMYYRNSYLTEYDSQVLSCEKQDKGYAVVLSGTIFYPEGGGQKCDTGYLDDVRVFDVQERNDMVIHWCQGPLEVGKTVHGRIDWQERFDHMQNHTGEHIVSGLIHKNYGYENVGFHMGEVIQIDFDGVLDWNMVQEIERQANEVIEGNYEIRELFPDQKELETISYRSKKALQGTIRLVEVPNADLCACCGTHVRRTGEVGVIKIISAEKHKNGVRLQMLSGRKCREYLNRIFEEARYVSEKLSAPITGISEYVDKLNDRNIEATSQLNQLRMDVLTEGLKDIENDQYLCLQFLKDYDRISITRYMDMLMKNNKGRIIGVINEKGDGYEYMFMSETVKLRDYARKINEALEGRGGGKDNVIQGLGRGERMTVENTIREIFREVDHE